MSLNVVEEQVIDPDVLIAAGHLFFLKSGHSFKNLNDFRRRYTCLICKNTYTKKYLKVHTRIHTGEKPYGCNECETRFSRSDELTRHKLTHSGEKLYPCTICERKFMRRDHLKKHMDRHKNPNGRLAKKDREREEKENRLSQKNKSFAC